MLRVVYDDGRPNTAPLDVTDTPMPTVMASVKDIWHYTVVKFEDGYAERSMPGPAPTIRAGRKFMVTPEESDRAGGGDKPPYAVPLMADVHKSPLNGLTVASTFAGGGGSCTGYRMAGFRVAWANEFEPAAGETYRANHPDTVLDQRDIRTLGGKDIPDAVGEVDVFDGSPPCQSFSMAGQRSKSWGRVMSHADGTHQRSDDLFFDYARLLGELQPKAFIAENVAGLVTGVAKGYFKRIFAALVDQGYVVKARVLDAQWLGVPQARRRVIIMGIRSDLGLEPAFPKPLPYRYSVAEACPWIVRQGHSMDLNEWKEAGRDPEVAMRAADEPSPTITTAQGLGAVGVVDVAIEGANGFNGHAPQGVDAPAATVQAGRPVDVVTTRGAGIEVRGKFNRRDAAVHGLDGPAPTVMAGGMAGGSIEQHEVVVPAAERARVADPNGPSPTILASDAGWSDVAVERRKLTIPEVRRICSFPDDYVLMGTYQQQWARLGNSVPPLMMKAVAESLAEVLLG